ncbi:hypothetical protein PsorP6_003090 [Peronosclerospora sorghi]|uniref:Uncharacterized protein n=1 Tax=Peronosclerospora sorghi TaxID=230839 RepID=A0ACC0VLS8_9STRA|nr:hypothetical protein PsorP6_003090 [Peronosclerospora sorghi]
MYGEGHDSGPLFTTSFHVHSLNAYKHDIMLRTHDTVWLVDYYAPWCPHCREFAPAWEQVATFYALSDKVQVGAVDCTEDKDICNQEMIRGYPGVKLHHVPADAETSRFMVRGTKSTQSVILWAERLMEEHGIRSGVDTNDLTAQLEKLRKNRILPADGDPRSDFLVYSDQSLEAKYTRLQDAGMAVLSIVETDFFMGTNVLEGERFEVALLWVEALAASFPFARNRQVLSELVALMKTSTKWRQGDWNVLLDEWKEFALDRTFPVSLFTSSGNDMVAFCTTYTCRVWTLFHSMTVNITNGTETAGALGQWKPSKLMLAIRLYIKTFFGCEKCREHFLHSNPESVIENLAARDTTGPHSLILWIWKMHNTVNERLKKPQWPSRRVCPVCYVDNQTSIALDAWKFHEDAIVAYVASAYGYVDDEIHAIDVAQHRKRFAVWSSAQGFSAMMMVLVLVALFVVAYKTRTYRSFDRKVLFMTRDHVA